MDCTPVNHPHGIDLNLGSDYGSDFTAEEEDLVNELLAKLPSQHDTFTNLAVADLEDDEEPGAAQVSRTLGREQRSRSGTPLTTAREAHDPNEVHGNSRTTEVESHESRSEWHSSRRVEAIPNPEVTDTLSPLERFRTAPKKPLSVTDLISPSWCELQYWYTLTKHGRKKRTPAMRQGSKVHTTLEAEVHKTVTVKVTSKEESFGLRVWNTIQGLRTLRDTGMTRELEVWGVIDGQVVCGIIDELSYMCPDRELEAEITAPKRSTPKGEKNVIPATQTTMTSFLKPPSGDRGPVKGVIKDIRKIAKSSSKIYITDVKTRGTNSIPKGASFRPTLMQLMLYHSLLSDLATNKVDPSTIFHRYALNPSAPFTGPFIAQVGSLNEVFYDAPSSPLDSTPPSDLPPPNPSQDPLHLLLTHNSLSHLWTLLISEINTTFPHGAASIGAILKAEYRDQISGAILGIKTFVHDPGVLHTYVQDELAWWKGKREAQGVSVEEAYKCRTCEFADECGWRKGKIEEAMRAVRARAGAGQKSVV